MRGFWKSRAKWIMAIGMIVGLLAMSIGQVNLNIQPTNASSSLSIGSGHLVLTIGNRAYASGTLDYGYNGNAAHDTAQIQALLAVLASHGGGEMITLTSNVTVTGAITVPANVVIRGSGTSSYFARNGVNPVFTASANDTFYDMSFDTPSNGITKASDTQVFNINGNTPTGRGATYVIAASDSSSSMKAQADNVSTGVSGADDEMINNAINLVTGAGTHSGSVFIAAGNYSINAPIYYQSFLTLQGVGGSQLTTNASGTVIHLANGSNSDMLTNPSGIAYLTHNVRISNLNLDANKAGNAAGSNLNISNLRNASFEHMTLQAAPDNGILASVDALDIRLSDIMVGPTEYGNAPNKAGIKLINSGEFILSDITSVSSTEQAWVINNCFSIDGRQLFAGESNLAGMIIYSNSRFIKMSGLLISANSGVGLQLQQSYYVDLTDIQFNQNSGTDLLLQWDNEVSVKGIRMIEVTGAANKIGIDIEDTAGQSSHNNIISGGSVNFTGINSAAFKYITTGLGNTIRDISVLGVTTVTAAGSSGPVLLKDNPGAINGIGARVYNNVSTNISSGNQTSLTFNTEIFDTNDLHSTLVNTSRLVATIAGTYVITGQLAFDTNGLGERMVRIVRNSGNAIGQVSVVPLSSGYSYVEVTTTYFMNAGDYVELYAMQSGAPSLQVISGVEFSPIFSMQKVD